MGFIKFPQDIFVGSQELNRFKSFISEEGFRKLFAQNSIEYGIFNVSKNGNFTNFRVEQGINQGTIKISEGLAIDKNVKLIFKSAEDNVPVADDNTWYWIKAKHKYSTTEIGTVSIDANGNLTGVGTKFKEVLRGLPSVQSLVRLEGSIFNTGEYHVNEVIDDTNAILQGTFQAESGLKLVVIGSFTPGVSPESADKEIFNYDSCDLTFVQEAELETSPAFVEGEEFYIARVKNNAGSLIIQDLRSRFVYKSKDAFLTLVDQNANPLIGVEAVKWGHPNETKDRNIVHVAWGFRSNNWSYNPSLNRVTLNAGEGGKYKTTGDFVDNDFNGWRLYTEDGNYSIIKGSAKQGSQINLDLDSTDFARFANATQKLLAVPDADSVLIHMKPEESFEEIAEDIFSYPINTDVAKVRAIAYNDPESSFIVKYKYKKGVNYSIERVIPSDTVGYYSETSFNSTGTLKIAEDRVRVPYVSSDVTGFIKLTLANNSYKRIIDQFTNGDAFGLNLTALNNEEPVTHLTPGVSIAEQIFDHASEPIVFEVDHFINLVTENEDGLPVVRDGNSFTLQFEGGIDLNGNTLKVVSGYINTGQIGTEILSIDQTFLDRAVTKNARVKFIYDLESEVWKYFVYNVITGSAPPSGAAGGDLTGSYPNPSIANNAVNTAKIADFAVSNSKLDTGSVTTSKIGDFSVTGAKIASNSVSTLKLADLAVTNEKIANNDIENAKMANNTLRFSKMYDGAGTTPESSGVSGAFAINLVDVSGGFNNAVVCRNGIYSFLSGGSLSTENAPPSFGAGGVHEGILVVVKRADGAYIKQFGMANNGRTFMRIYASGSWNAWVENS